MLYSALPLYPLHSTQEAWLKLIPVSRQLQGLQGTGWLSLQCVVDNCQLVSSIVQLTQVWTINLSRLLTTNSGTTHLSTYVILFRLLKTHLFRGGPTRLETVVCFQSSLHLYLSLSYGVMLDTMPWLHVK